MMGQYIAKYLAMQIEQLKLAYKDVIAKHPREKSEINKILKEDNMQHLIETDDE